MGDSGMGKLGSLILGLALPLAAQAQVGLAAFSPDIITIESLAGEECDLAARQPAKCNGCTCRNPNAARTTP